MVGGKAKLSDAAHQETFAVFGVFRAPDAPQLTRRNSENVQNSTTHKKLSDFPSISTDSLWKLLRSNSTQELSWVQFIGSGALNPAQAIDYSMTELYVRMRLSLNANVVGLCQFLANPKSNGFSDSFGFGFSFRFGKPEFTIRRNLPSVYKSKQMHTE